MAASHSKQPSAAPKSYQLPNLLSYAKPFGLRTNRHCRAASRASETWFLQGFPEPQPNAAGGQPSREEDVSIRRQLEVRGTKPGLLAALCYPVCDASQLRLVTDFLSLLMIENGTALRTPANGLVDPRCTDLCTRVSRLSAPSCFFPALHEFRAAQLQLESQLDTSQWDFETFIENRRKLSGLHMAFALIETVMGLTLRVDATDVDSDVARLTRDAADIVAWSLDILSFHVTHRSASSPNILQTLMQQRGISLAAATCAAGVLVKEKVDSFLQNEATVLSSFQTLSHPDDEENWESREDDTRTYVQGLRDWIAGAMHWAYENEMWFGGKGEAVREFGWVFLKD